MADADVARRSSSKRPPDTDFYQQRLKAWQPILTPGYVTVTFCVIGAAFCFIGWGLWSASAGVVEASVQYDGEGASATDCMITSQNEKRVCTVDITPTEDMEAPVYVYYQLDNFYQNHRRYVKSRSDAQLRGELVDGAYMGADDLEDCDPLIYDPNATDKVLYPCGLIAYSFFNDVIGRPMAVGEDSWSESDISWASDRESKFLNPDPWPPTAADKEKYTFLHDRYDSISEEEGVTNEHFIVWMRTAALPNFRKLYARITTDLKADTTYSFPIEANFQVDSFKGKKFLVVSTTSWLGGKNDFLGVAYVVVGALCLVLGILFYVRYKTSGRELGDPKYLNWRR
mmetsp:Transcript_28885/g.68110  ORF Transcript_28885/g.68110 Transcript_28885/m.68110 type:complete len:342 (-) Transcript_28885:60-1085(-)